MKLPMFKFWLAIATVCTASAARICCNKECGAPNNDCATMRDVAFSYWEGYRCANPFYHDCKKYGATGLNENFCCRPNSGLPGGPWTPPDPAIIEPLCANPELYATEQEDSTCLDMKRMVYDPEYQYIFTQYAYVPLEDACLGTGALEEASIPGYGNYICNSDSIRDGFAGGEPHFKTWAGEWYDYHGVCDLVLMDAPDAVDGLGLSIHIRTKARYDYSFIESAAIQIGGDHILEVSSWADYALNGVQGANLPAKLGDCVVTYRQISDKEHQFRVKLDMEIDGEELVVNVFKDMVSVKVEEVTEKSFGTSRGLLGSFGEGSLVGRNGTVFSLDDPSSFAEDWQVLPDEPKLFVNPNRFPQAPSKCIRPDPAAKAARRRLGETVRKEAALAACAHWQHKDACVYDVMATGDLDLAKATPY